MDEFVKQLSQKTGIAQDKAEQVGNFLKEHGVDAANWIKQDDAKLSALLSEKVGVTKEEAGKIVQTLKTQSGDWTKYLGQKAGDALKKVEGAAAGLFGRK